MSKKKILIVTSEFPPQPGGIGNHAYNLAVQLSMHDYSVELIADQRSHDGLEEIKFDKKLPFKTKRIGLTKPRFLMYFVRLNKIFKAIRGSETVIATGKFSLWTVAVSSLFIKRNYFAVVHGTEVNFKKRWLRNSVNWALSRFYKIIAVSNYTKRLVEHLDLEVIVIPNGIDFQKWSLNAKLQKTLKGYPKLITVGNVTSRKGQQNVIAHLPFLIEKYPNIHYHCIGLNTETEDFMEKAKLINVVEHISFYGRVSDEELQSMLLDSDIFVMLSTATLSGDVEGFGIAILEANSQGIPAIGSIGCGIEDAIENNMNGLLVDPKDEKAFENAINQILKNQNAFQGGALSWSNKHDWSKVVQLYLDHLP